MNEPAVRLQASSTKPFGRFLWGRRSLFRRTVTLALAVGLAWGSAIPWGSLSKRKHARDLHSAYNGSHSASASACACGAQSRVS